MMQHAEQQGLLAVKSIFMDDLWLMCETHAGAWQVDKGLNSYHGLPGQYTRFIYSFSISNNNIKELPPGIFAGEWQLSNIFFLTCKILKDWDLCSLFPLQNGQPKEHFK